MICFFKDKNPLKPDERKKFALCEYHEGFFENPTLAQFSYLLTFSNLGFAIFEIPFWYKIALKVEIKQIEALLIIVPIIVTD